MSHSLNCIKGGGGYIGDSIGEFYRGKLEH